METRESELGVTSLTELEEPQRPDAVPLTPESPAVEPPWLEQKTNVCQHVTRYRFKILVYCGIV